ncbi:MAG: rane metalloprotease [Solimicrobium sp.]|jgi:Zn-dependent protease|nr:rane metalloprotease [Solimicrobium sp.]
MNELIQNLSVYAIPVIFAITLHESAHAYVAKYFGDNTAYSLGRLSLNPIKHIDPVGTLLIPVVLYLMTSGSFVFGYAKPVPIDFSRLKNPKRDMAWVALAGPASNFFMALGWMLGGYFLAVMQISEPFLVNMMRAGVLANLVMFALNLFPMLPLDGGRILASILPLKQSIQFSKIEPYGFFIVLGLMILNLFKYWLIPVMVLAQASLQLLLSPLQLLIN